MSSLEKVEQHIYRITEQFFYGEKVATYLINLGKESYLFDLPTYSEQLEKRLLKFNVTKAILSHGSCGIKDGEIWRKNLGIQIVLHKLDAQHPWLRIKPDKYFDCTEEFPHAEEIKILHTLGHSAGSISLWDTRTKSIFTGDTLYADKKGNLIDFYKFPDNFSTLLRLKSARKILSLKPRNIFPFHGYALEKIFDNLLLRDNFGNMLNDVIE